MIEKSLPYPSNTCQLFSSLANQPYAILLQSNPALSGHSRYDIMSANPETVIIQDGHQTRIIEQETDTLTERTPFDLVNDYLSSMTDSTPSSAPFTQGALGYFGYDTGRILEKISTIAKNDLPFYDTCMGIYRWSIVVDHQEKTCILYTPNNDIEAHILKTLNQSREQDPFKLTSAFESNLSETAYKEAFDHLMQDIDNGNCYEANLCQRFSASYQGSSWSAYSQLAQAHLTAFSSYFHTPKGDIACFSPERFINVHDRQASTKPIKGTAKRDKNPTLDNAIRSTLAQCPKNRAENLMIVDLMRNDFSKCCEPGSVLVPSLFDIESHENVHHMVSTIVGKLDDSMNSMDLFKACFPGGSITGAPKVSAMNIIDRLEPHRRKIYCGSLGYWSQTGNMDSNIIIRSLFFDQDHVYCYAGGAIVKDSISDLEYQECMDKVIHLLSSLEATVE